MYAAGLRESGATNTSPDGTDGDAVSLSIVKGLDGGVSGAGMETVVALDKDEDKERVKE